MSEREWADRLSRDVDELLRRAERVDDEPASDEYRELLKVAGDLATLDPSRRSRIRVELRGRLLQQLVECQTRVGAPTSGWHIARAPRPSLLILRHPAWAALALLLVLLIALSLMWPHTLTAVADGARRLVEFLRLGPHTTVEHSLRDSETVSSPTAATATPLCNDPTRWQTPEVIQVGDRWMIRTAIGSFGGNVPRGHENSVQRFPTLDKARAVAPYPLYEPTYLPPGYTLSVILVAPDGTAFAFYNGPQGGIVLEQTPVAGLEATPSPAAPTATPIAGSGGWITQTVVVEKVEKVVVTQQEIQAVTLNGVQAAWVQGYGLVWEADSVSYLLGGPCLSLDEALRIASSLG